MQIYLAPMEGITTYLYRSLFEKYYGGIDKYFTPFLVGTKLSRKEINDILPEHNPDVPLVPQILTSQANIFLAIAKQLQAYGYTEVNLNLGCPSGTVVRKKHGAGFLSVPDQLDRFLDEIYEKCPLEISVKTRLGIDALSEWDDLLSIYKKYPIKELIIHTRLQQEFYRGGTHPEAFQAAQAALTVPLCYNGDISSVASYHSLLEKTDLPAIMLGRGAIANPQLPCLIRESCEPRSQCDIAKDFTKFQAFHDELLAGYTEIMSDDKTVLFRMKELWAYMREYLELTDRQLKQLQKTNNLPTYKSTVRTLFLSAGKFGI